MSRPTHLKVHPPVRLFVYGTLRDAAVRDAVAGSPIAQNRLAAAHACDWRTVYFPGAHFPGLVRATGQRAEGLIISDVSQAELERFDRFEGSDYVRTQMEVTSTRGAQKVEVYLPAIDIDPNAPCWSLERWTRLHRRDELALYRETLFRELDERTNR